LWGFTWIHDLARPDRLFAWDNHPFIVPFFGMRIVSLNVLPVLLAVVFFLQQKTQPQPPAQTPEQEQQRKMMQWMSLLFPVFLYSAPSGLNLYILTSTTLGIIESKRIRNHIKQIDEAEKANKVIIDAKITRAGKQNRKQDRKEDFTAAKPGKSGGWLSKVLGSWTDLQQRVEDMRRDAERKSKGD
jgi:YidC/Oxa1 family membrane protein insertase